MTAPPSGPPARPSAAAAKLQAARTSGRITVGEVVGLAGQLHRQPGALLFGVLGGGIGLAIAAVIAATTAVSGGALGVAGVLIGVSGGILLARRGASASIETEEEARRIEIARIEQAKASLWADCTRGGVSKAFRAETEKRITALNDRLIALTGPTDSPVPLLQGPATPPLPPPAGAIPPAEAAP